MMFVADDLAAWLISVLADAVRKKLTSVVLGTDQKRALRSAATAAVQLTAAELRPDDAEQAEQLAMVVSEIFGEPVPGAPLAGSATLLEALQAGIAGQLAVLSDASLTGTGQSSADVLGVPGTVVAAKLTGHLVHEIAARGSRGGPLEPLANQLNHDVTHLQGQRIEAVLGQLADEVREALTRLGGIQALAAVPVALAQLPPATAGFTGRDDELAVLAGLLDPDGSGGPVVVSAVAGLAGVGKSTLAVQAGHAAQRRGWFGGGVLFVDLHGYDEAPVEPGQALDALLRAIGVPAAHILPTVEERAALYRSVLARISDPVLVIADNASTEAQVRPLLPGVGPHKVLVTSRNTLAGLGARLVDITVLDEAAAIELLDAALRAARPDDIRVSDDREAAARLARICGGLPLALQIVAAVLNADPALNTAELASQFTAEKNRLAALRYDDGSGQSAPSVAAAFELSYHRLDETAARVFRLLPVSPGPDVSTESAAVLADLPVPEGRRVLAGLAAAHLAEAAPGRPGRWRMHDLVRLYAQGLSDTHAEADGREQARDRLLGYYLGMTRAADVFLRVLPGMDASGGFAVRDAALAWLDGERASLVAAVQMAADTGRDQAALGLPLSLDAYLRWRRRFDDSITITTTSLNTARRLRDRHGEGAALNNLGIALREVRRFEEAITVLQDAAALCRDTGDRHGEAMALTNLGPALREVRRFEEAITVLQDAAAIYREAGDRHSEGMALGNLGGALHGVRRFEEAITALQDAAAIYREAGDHQREAMALSNLAAALHGVRRFEEAITALQDAAAIYHETGDRHSEAMALTSLGLALREVGVFGEAITALQDAAAMFRDTDDHHGEAMALTNLGPALQGVRRFEEAITALQDATALYHDTGDHHSEGMALGNLGVALQGVRRFEEAITALQDATALYRETGDHHSEAIALTSLGPALREVGRFEEAITALQDATGLYHETGDHHGEAGALINLGIALRQAPRFEEAIAAFQAAAALYHETGDRHSEAMALNNLGPALAMVGRFEETVAALQGAAALCRDTGDRQSEAMALNNLGPALAEVGRFEEAIAALQGAAATYRDLGDRPGEAMVLTNLGHALLQASRFDDAIAALQAAAGLCRETGDRQSVAMALNNLGPALAEVGRFEESVAALQAAAVLYRENGDRRGERIALDNLARAAQLADVDRG